MKRLAWAVVLALVVPVSASLAAAGEVVPKMYLEKDCVVFGRLDGHRIKMLYPVMEEIPDLWSSEILELKGFMIFNLYSGKKQKLEVTEDGYFCLNIDPGTYELGTTDSSGRWIAIDSFRVPHGRMVNLGTYRVEMKSGALLQDWAWHPCTIGPVKRSVRFNHLGDTVSYNDCEEWFADCHDAVYAHFASLPLRH